MTYGGAIQHCRAVAGILGGVGRCRVSEAERQVPDQLVEALWVVR